MYPPKFEYYRAGSVAEALSLMSEHGGKFLAGGHSLIPTMKLRLADPGVVIDIGGIADLKGISVSNGTTKVGSLTTHRMVEFADQLPDILPEAAGWIGDPMVRNRGTVGGNIAHADPASDLPTVLTALRATMHIEGADGSRSVTADDFFIDLFETALGEDEILTAVTFPSKTAGSGSAYAKLFNPASRYAMVGAAAVVEMQGNVCRAASVVVGGLTPVVRRCSGVEKALAGQAMNDANLDAAAAHVANDLANAEVMGDIHASEEYRRAMAPVFVKRALAKAISRA